MIDPHLTQAIIKTVIYHGVFSYPLSKSEINRYLIGYAESDPNRIEQAIGKVCQPDQYQRYSLGRVNYEFQLEYQTQAWQYLQQTQQLATLITRYLPFIHTVGVSGSVGALYAVPQSDIDLFVISYPNTAWICRAFLLAYLRMRQQHVNTKKPTEQNVGKYCVNYIVDGSAMEIPHQRQDLYTALEIAHLQIIYNQNHAFQCFLSANSWIKEYLPNYWRIAEQEWQLNNGSASNMSLNRFYSPFNSLLAALQRFNYARSGKQSLKLNNWITDHRVRTLQEYETRLKEINMKNLTSVDVDTQ